MFEDLKTTKENIANLNDKLYNERSYIELGWLHSAITGPLYYHPDISDTEYLKKINSPEARENTLAYLKRLLEQGKLKVGGLDILHPDEKGISHFREFKGTSEEIIDEIRKEWNEADKRRKQEDPSFLGAFESFGIIFTLPENEWPKF